MKTYKVTTIVYVKDKNLQRLNHVVIAEGLTWEQAKELRGKGMSISPEVRHEYLDSEQPTEAT